MAEERLHALDQLRVQRFETLLNRLVDVKDKAQDEAAKGAMVRRRLPAGLRHSRARVDEWIEHDHLSQRLILVNNLLLLLEALKQKFVGLASRLLIRANLRVRL